jgi:hypothetical protein
MAVDADWGDLLNFDEMPPTTLGTGGDVLAGETQKPLVPGFGRGPGGIVGRRNLQKTAAQRHGTAANSVGQEAVMADSNESRGEHVQEKAAQEGVGVQRHESGRISMGAILPAEGDLTVLERDEPLVGNGNAMSVSAEVGQDLLGSREGRLGVDDPFLPGRLGEEEGGAFAGEAGQASPVQAGLDAGKEFSAEDAGEDADGKEETGVGEDPAVALGRQASPGDNAVEVGVEEKRLGPGVQNGGEPDLGAQTLGIEGDLLEGVRHAREKEAVHSGRIGEEERREFLGNGENDMEVLHREKIRLSGLNPAGFVKALTLGTMAIPAGVVGNLLVTTFVALPEMAAERGGATSGDGLDDPELVAGKPVEPVGARAKEIGQLQAAGGRRRSVHGY